MNLPVELIGSAAAVITSLCWVPQMVKMFRERQTAGVSLIANGAFASGVFLWLVYGILIGSWPLIGANLVTLACALSIVALKLRYG
ncbi:SemiSWEET family sugar transporter [Mesorhizobium sp. J428]|uniref:SemiSWEET family sugar transporter n=1 Tax=Mesorhizobium sp. J428 TaxID=2898440 RepID=UPI0021514D8C|nr:SemiSWEET transporter [Mesorhizobium sp. J428]MCR5855521.1 SemiSWEET transporter [Mesorhizobium sp. J428]